MDKQLLMNMMRMMDGPRNVDPYTLAKNTNRSLLVSQQENAVQTSAMQANFGYQLLHSSISSISQSRGVSTLVDLIPENRVDINTLTENVNKVLHGKFFLCRTITPPNKITAIMTIVEDPKGQEAVILALYNYSDSDPADTVGLLQDLPVGQMLIIKSPWFKSTASGGYAVRSDNPADVIVITQSYFKNLFGDLQWKGEIPQKWQHLVKAQPQTAIEWKNEGNKLFANRKYEQAIQYYTEGLKFGETAANLTQVDVDILANRAAAYLKLECYHKALEDSERVLKIQPDHLKSIYRKSRSFYGLGRYSETISFSSEYIDKMNDNFNNLIHELTSKAEVCVKQQATGEYDIVKLYEMGSVYHENIADFTGPVQVKSIPGKGRGMIAAQEIQEGQLVLVSKALAVIFEDNLNKCEVELHINTDTKYIDTASQRLLIQKVTNKLRLEPILRRQVFQLYAGLENPIPEESKVEHDLDIKRIESICFYNSFGGRKSKKSSKSFGIGDASSTSEECSGLWILPSFINHSCWDCNCSWINYGDVMFIRAFRKIATGEEILISYTSPAALYETREKIFKKHGFVCDCRLCTLDRGTGPGESKRKKMLAEVEKFYESKDFTSMFDSVKKFDRLEPRLKINPYIVLALTELAQHYTVTMHSFQKSNSMLLKARDIANNSALTTSMLMDTTVNILGNFAIMNDKKNISKWIKVLKKDLLNTYGTVEMARIKATDTLKFLEKIGIPFF